MAAIPKTEFNKRKLAERKAAGLVEIPRTWVTPEQKIKVIEYLKELRDGKLKDSR
jgi:hypothetical protein